MAARYFSIPAIAFAVVTVSAPARAIDDDPRKALAEPSLRQGQRLYALGKYDDALLKLREAYGIYASPNVLSLIALVEQSLGRSLDSIGHFREALRNPTLHPENADLSRKAIAQLEQRLARVDVHGPRGLAVTVSKTDVVLPLKEPVDVEPGTIIVDGKLGETPYHGQVIALPGKLSAIEMRADAAPNNAAATGADPNGARPFTPPPPEQPAESHWGTGQYLGIALGGVGVAAIAFGIGFTVAKGKSSDNLASLDALTDNGAQCAAGTNTPQCNDRTTQQSEHDRYGTLATGFFIGGAVAVVAGVVSFVVWPKTTGSTSNATHRPVLRPTAGGFQLHFN